MQHTTRKILTLPLRLAFIIIIFGALFKIMYWPYAHQLILIGNCLILVLYTIRFFYKNEKGRLDYVKLGLVMLWVFSYLNQAFHLLDFPYIFEIVLATLFIWWLIEEGFSYFTNRKLKNSKVLKTFYYTLIIITSVLLVFGLLFKTMHWPFGALLFTLGILFLSLVILVDYLAIERT